MQKKVLITFKNIGNKFGNDWDILDFSWSLCLGERALITCEKSTQYDFWFRFLHRKFKPIQGYVEELNPVFTYSDELLKNRLNLSQTVVDSLNSRLFDARPWIGGRPLQARTLLDLVEIESQQLHQPLEKIDPISFNKFWVVIFMLTKARLLISRTITTQLDEVTSSIFRDWSNDYIGALIAMGELQDQPSGLFKTWIKVQYDGSYSITEL